MANPHTVPPGEQPDRPQYGGHKPVISIHFGPTRADEVRAAAYADGLSPSVFIRQIVDREIARRTRRCPVCGQTVPAGFGEQEAVNG